MKVKQNILAVLIGMAIGAALATLCLSVYAVIDKIERISIIVIAQ